MPDNANLDHTFRIGKYVVNTQNNTITNSDETTRLEPRAMALLTFLVEHHGQLCSKKQISESLWSNQIITDEAIARLIFVVRNALKDDAKSPKFIETVPKKGYIFLEKPRKTTAETSIGISGVGTVILVLSILVYLFYFVSSSNQSYEILRSTPLTHTDGREYSYTPLAEGFAYLQTTSEGTAIILNDGSEPLQQLVNNKWHKRSLRAYNKTLIYVRFYNDTHQIIRRDAFGNFDILFESEKPIFSVVLGPDRSSIVFNQYVNNDSVKLFQYTFVDEKVEPFGYSDVVIPSKVYLPTFSRHSDKLYFVGVESQSATLYGFDRGNSEPKNIITQFNEIEGFTETNNKHEVLVAGKYGYSQGIWRVNLSSQEIDLVFQHPDKVISEVHFQNDGFVYSTQGLQIDLVNKSFDTEEKPLKSLNSTRIDRLVKFTSQGNIVISSNRTGDFELYLFDIKSGETKRITDLKAHNIWHYAISGDDSKIAVVFAKDNIQLGVVDLESGILERKSQLDEIKFPLDWSRDGTTIYISEHLKNIALYSYDAETLDITNKKVHLGLTALEIDTKSVIAFDYTINQFVSYNFLTDVKEPLSTTVANSHLLAPHHVHIDKTTVTALFEEGLSNSVKQFGLSVEEKRQTETLKAEIIMGGKIQGYYPDLSGIIYATTEQSQGDLIKLVLSD